MKRKRKRKLVKELTKKERWARFRRIFGDRSLEDLPEGEQWDKLRKMFGILKLKIDSWTSGKYAISILKNFPLKKDEAIIILRKEKTVPCKSARRR